MRRYFFIFGIILNISLFAQEDIVILKGQIVDSLTNEPVPFANIRLNNFYYGTATNIEGRFELKLKTNRFTSENELRLSCIGYVSKRISLSEIDPLKYQKLILKASSQQLNEVVVKGERAKRRETNQAKTLIMDAIDRIPANKVRSKYLAKGFYRHYCKEDTAYVRLTEAAIDYTQNDVKPTLVQIPQNRLGFGIKHLRRSYDYTSFAKLSHPPISLNFLLSNDINNYEFHNPLRKNLDNYEFYISDTTNFEQDQVVIIEFENKEKKQLSYSGKIYINLRDKAFIRADFLETQISTNKVDSIHSIVDKKVFYDRINGRYYANRIISDVTATHHALTHPHKDPIAHKSHVELMINEFIPKTKELIESEEPSEEDLREITYDSAFWNSYIVLEATPLEQKIIDDLSSKVDLQKQFKSANALKDGVQSLIQSAECQNVLNQYKNTPTYVIFWAKWKIPNYYEVLPSPIMRKLIAKEKVNLVMISLDEDEEKWLLNREVYGFDNSSINHHRIDLGYGEESIRNFFSDILPDFLVIDENGEIVDHHPPFPNQVMSKDYFRNISQASNGN